MDFSKQHRNKILTNIIQGKDHRIIIQSLIDKEFLERVMLFFEKIVNAKLKNKEITGDWYKSAMLSKELHKEDIARNAGLALKSIVNIHGSQSKDSVIDASKKHYEILLSNINDLVTNEINVNLTIALNGKRVSLSLNESLIVINAIAVMKSGIIGSIWSAMGKSVEKPLIILLCKMLCVNPKYYENTCIDNPDNPRESDFFLMNDKEECIRCEIKLMGKGNPENADGALARETKLFVADQLSDQNKTELEKRNILWVAMADGDTLEQFSNCLDKLGIPHKTSQNNLETILDEID